jgi:hypothetical protein
MWILALACVGWAVVIVVLFGLGYDSHAYWQAWRGDSLYDRAPTERDAFLYSPAFAQAIWPLAQVPFPVFCAIFTIAPALAFGWLLRVLPRRTAVPCWLMTMPEIVTGNIFWLLALAAVWGMGRGGWWVATAITKVTPFLGPLWFLARREWWQLGWCLGVTLLVVGASYSLDPRAWQDWVAFLLDNQSGSQGPLGDIFPLFLRLPVAVALVVWAAITDRAWALPVAMVVATPVLATASFTMLAAIPRLRETSARRRPPERHLGPSRVPQRE